MTNRSLCIPPMVHGLTGDTGLKKHAKHYDLEVGAVYDLALLADYVKIADSVRRANVYH